MGERKVTVLTTTKEKAISTEEMAAKNIDVTSSIPKFYITLHPHTFPTRESFELGKITNWFKRNGRSERFTIEEILKFSSEGRCYIPAHIETDGTEYEFISSQLIFVDVDDDNCVTNPYEVLERLKDICAGLYFTSSHGIKGNRYRLAFILDKTIRDTDVYRDVFKQLAKRLIKSGIPADTNVQNGLQRIRTAMNGYILSNPNARLEIDEYIELAREERQKLLEARASNIIDLAERRNYRIRSFEELLDMAKHIGYVDDRQEWIRLGMSIKSYVEEGHIDDIQGYEIFSHLCGGNDETVTWETFKPVNTNIGAFIKKANECGFKNTFKYYHAISKTNQNVIPVEIKKFDQYIDVEYAKEVLQSEQKVLFKAPTGSGKTSSFIEAAKQLSKSKEKPSRYYLFAAPTRAITEQIRSDYNVLCINGKVKNPYKELKDYHDAHSRVIACTYDMAEIVVQLIKKINPFSSCTLIVDEIHQFVSSYKYRSRAIETLDQLKEVAKGFIGLSGTPQDVLKETFEKEIHIEVKDSKAPCQMFGAITYKKQDDEFVELIKLIKQKTESNKKLLVFLQNIKAIKNIAHVLRTKGVRVKTVVSDEKDWNTTYQHIVNNSEFPTDTDVILTTTVLSDGININNSDLNFECIVVCSKNSKIFDVSTIRQMSNRFRRQKGKTFAYQAFYLFMLEPKATCEYHYNIESAYNYEKKLAENSVELLKEEFSGPGNHRLARLAKLEQYYGITCKNGVFDFNKNKVRYNVWDEKGRFYFKYRSQFLEACSAILGVPLLGTLSVEQAVSEDGNRFKDEVTAEIERLSQSKVIDPAEFIENAEIHYTPIIHEAFKFADDEQNSQMIQEFKRICPNEHFSCIKGIAEYASYETTVKVVKQVTRRNEIHSFRNRVNALINKIYFEKVRRKTPERKVYEMLLKHSGKSFTPQELKELFKDLGKRSKVAKAEQVKQICERYFYYTESRSKKERFKTFHPITNESILAEFNVTESELNTIMHNLMQNDDSIQQLVLSKKTKTNR